MPAHETVLRIGYALGIGFPVLVMGVLRTFAVPVTATAAEQMHYFTAYPLLHQVEQVLVPLAGVLSLVGVIGLTGMAIGRSPWLAMTGGFLALAGWGTLPLWAGQDNLTYLMGRLGADPQLVELWNQFNTAGTNTYLYLFVIGHLAGPLLLSIALARASVVPPWSAVLTAVSVPLHVVTFVTGIWYFDPIGYALLAVALVPAITAVFVRPVIGGGGSRPPR